MDRQDHHSPGITTLLGRLVRTGVGAVQNRVELFAVEWQEEKLRLTEILVWAVALVFFAVMGMILITATVIFLFKEELRVYVVGAFALLYLVGAMLAWTSLRALLRREPFAETVDQARKDKAWFKSLD